MMVFLSRWQICMMVNLMSDKYFMCCERCFGILGRKSSNAAKIWMDICAVSLNVDRDVVSIEGYDKEVRVLEKSGFVISTELDSGLWVKVKGHYTTSNGEHYFCSRDGKHE